MAPTALEESLALTMRRLATPRAMRAATNPVEPSPEVVEEALARMESLNPKSPQAFRDEEEARRFLEGGDAPAAPQPTHTHK